MMPQLRPIPIVRWQLGNAGFQPMKVQRRLAEGFLAAPDLSSEAVDVLRDAVDKIIGLLARENEALIVEVDLVSPAALRVEPEAASQISYIGNLPPQEIRSAILVAAREIGNRAARAAGGALSSYLTADQFSRLSEEKMRAAQIVALIQNQDTVNVSPQSQAAFDGYLSVHLKDLDAAVVDAEKAVVTAEAGSVPVLEPSERSLAVNVAVGVGLVAVTGFVLWQIFG